jgi:hypothetical protein
MARERGRWLADCLKLQAIKVTQELEMNKRTVPMPAFAGSQTTNWSPIRTQVSPARIPVRRLWLRSVTRARCALLCLSIILLPGAAQAEQVDVIEFFHPLLGHYFMAGGNEVALLDAGGAGGNWVRTGQSFTAWRYAEDAPATAFPVCRFYSYAKNSHFYTASPTECEKVKTTDPGWIYEGIAFYIERPENRECPDGLQPVLRSYNDRYAQNDSNHRYATLPSIIEEMTTHGWIAEGVAMCARQSTTHSGVRPDQASGTFRTDTTGTIETYGSAQVSVPVGAVAPTPNGSVGSTTVTVAIDTSTRINLPEGDQLAGRVYNLEPAGHVFQTPVRITLPLTVDPQDQEVRLFTQTSEGLVQDLGGYFDPIANTITAQTLHFSPFWPGLIGNPQRGESCIQIDNSFAPPYSWKSYCVSAVNALEDPFDSPSADARGLVDGPLDAIPAGSSRRSWRLPPGNYDVCVDVSNRDTQMSSPYFMGSYIYQDVRVARGNGSGGTWGDSCVTSLDVSNPSPLSPNRCICGATLPTPGGMGAAFGMEISLNWRADPGVDLDLHVTEPTGETIFYSHQVSATGGTLDWDNKCSNYVNGRTENVSWATPPVGRHRVEVNCYGGCAATSATEVPFQVNVKRGGTSQSYLGTAICGAAPQLVTEVDYQGRGFGSSGRALYDGQPATLSLVFQGTSVTGRMEKEGVCRQGIRLTRTVLQLVGTLAGDWEGGAGARIDGTWTGGDSVCGTQLTLADGYPLAGTFTIMRGTGGRIALERLGTDTGQWQYEFR